MKAAIALSRASECDVKSKDHVINQLQKDLAELKSQLFKEVIIMHFFLTHLLPLNRRVTFPLKHHFELKSLNTINL